jgi:hypothetical protein
MAPLSMWQASILKKAVVSNSSRIEPHSKPCWHACADGTRPRRHNATKCRVGSNSSPNTPYGGPAQRVRRLFYKDVRALWLKSPMYFVLELELDLIQTQMAQKPMLLTEMYARALCASRNATGAEVWVGARCAWWVGGA